MIRNLYVTVYRIVTGLYQRNTDRGRETSFLSLLLVLLAGSAVAQTQITGTVYRDFNADGVRSFTTSTPFDGEIGVGGVTVRLFNQNGLVTTTTSSTVTGATLGSYTLTVPASGTGSTTPFRVQFTSLPAGFFVGPRGTGSGTSVQFIASSSASNVNLGINYPTDYCQAASTLQMAVPCYENGSGVGNTNPAFVTFGYTNNGTTPEPDDDFRTQDLGSTWGVAYQRRSKQVFTSAFVKRHVGLGSRGADGVYRLDYSGATPTLAGAFELQGVVPANGGAAIDLGTVNRTNVTTTAIAAGSAGDNQLPASRSAPNVDLDAFAKVGKVGYGGIDFTEDESSLWLVNLNQRSLLRVNATDPASLSGTLPAALVNQYYILPTTGQPGITGAPTCTNGTLRPFGLKFYRGRGYLGCVCDAATSTTVRQPAVLTAYVLSFDPTNPTSFTTVLTVPLNYNREVAYRSGVNSIPGNWQRWTDTWNTDINTGGFSDFRSAPQPMLSDIEFAEDGSIVLGFADRFSHQGGTLNYAAISGDRTINSAIAAGDIIKATRTTTGYQLEGGETDPGPPPTNPLYPGFSTTDGAAGTGEFYWGDYFVNFGNVLGEGHYETATGGLTLLPGAGEVVSTVYDPTAFFTQGVRWFDQQTGTANRSYRVVESGNTAAQFGKASDLGDIELLCDPAPIEIGNRLFFDGSTATANGLQDNGSAGTLIAGAVVQLYRIVGGTATLVASTTTNAVSEYYFNNANVPGGLLPNTAYEIRVPLSQTLLTGFVPTTLNAGTDDAIDSDGILVGNNAVIALTTGNYGENNHSYDLGFACPTITSGAASVTVCGGTTNNALSVTTTAAGTNSIQFVFFSSPQSGTAMYTGGTSIGTATPVNGVATVSAPVNAVTTPTTIYVYALLNPVPNATSCRPSAEIQVTVRPSPTGTATSSGTVTCAASATVSGSSSLTGTTSYAWSGPNGFTSTAQSFTTAVAGTYSLTVTTNGCADLSPATTTVTANTITPGVTLNSLTLTCAQTSGTLTATVTNATNPVYRWSTGATTASISVTTAGTYSVTVTSPANGCTATATTTVQSNTLAPVVSATNTGPLTCTNTAVTVSASTTTANATYRWNTGITTPSFTTTTAGTYSVTVTAPNGCTAAASTVVTQNLTPPTVSASVSGTLTCAVTAATVSATASPAGSSFAWAGPGGFTSTAQSFITATPGIYSVTVTSSTNGCTATASTTVTQDITTPQNLSLTVSRALNCTATTAVLTASSSTTGVTYRFAGPGIIATAGSSATINAAGTYSVTATGANGCTATTTTTVTQDITPPAGVTATNTGPLTCARTSVSVSATSTTANVIYRWTGPGSFVSTSQSFTTATAGTYSVTVTSTANGCTTTAGTTVVQDITPPQNLSLAVSRVLTCTATTAVLTASSSTTGVTYRFAGPGIVASSGTSATVNASGTYSVTATAPNGCTATTITTVQSDTAAPTVFAANDGPITCAKPIVTVSVSPTSVGAAYQWSSGQTTPSFTTTVAGTYSVTVTGANGCTAVAATTVTQPPALSASTTQTNPTCNGGNNGSITVTATGGTPAYRYAWSTGAITPTVSGLTAGVYSVTVTDANTCTLVTSVTLTQPTALSLSAAVTNVACNGAATGSVDLTVSGGTGTYQYAWSTGAITQDITGVRAGTYTVTVTDQNNCVSRLTVTVTEPPALTLTISAQNVACNGGTNGLIDLTVAGGTAPYSYSWTNGSGQLVATTQDLINLSAGTYTVLVTDANACTATSRVNITQPTAITLTTTQQNVRCNGVATGSIDLTVAGGTGTYSYRWVNSSGQPVATTQDLTGLVAGAYSVTVTDANACTAITSVTITQPPALSLTTINQNPTCNDGNNGSINLTVNGGTAPYAYVWNDNVTSEDRTGLRAGTYSVIVTDANGCTATTSVTLTQPDVLSISGFVRPVTCFGGSDGAVSLTVTGGTAPYSFTWTNGSGQTIAQTQNIANLTAGNYSVAVADAAGCRQVFTAAVTQPEELIIDAAPIQIACPGQTVDVVSINVQGGVTPYAYRWTGPNNFTANTPSIFNVPAGSYTLVVTDANSCTAVEIIDIVQPPPFNLSAQVTPVSCFGGTNGAIDVTVTGASPPYSFTWSNGARTEDLTGIASGTYSVSVTDQNGCMTTISAFVDQPTQLILSETHTNVTCFDGQNGTIDLTVQGGVTPYAYAWSDGVNAEDRTGLRAGTYIVVVTDANGCTITTGVTITQPPALTLSAQVSDVACNGGSTGSISLTATGGTGTLTYRWSTGATTATISSLTAGVYSATVTDGNQCVAQGQFRVNQPDPLQITFTQQNIACNGAATGSINVNVTGGTTPYGYAWSDGTTTEDRTGLTAGVYSLTVTDANGCTATISITITQPPALTLTVTQQNVRCFGEANGTIDVTTTGGVAPYAFRWNDGVATEDRTGLTAGAYSLTVTDNNGCTATTSATITQPNLVTVTATNTGPLTCTLTSVTVSASSLTNVSYQWTGPNGFTSTAASFMTATPGTYVVVVTGVNGCSATAQTVVGQNITTPIVSANNTGPITCSNPSVTVSAISNRPDVTYQWSNGQTTASFSTTLAGTYSVTVTASNGCTATASTVVNQTLVAATLAQGSCNFNNTNVTAADDYFLITVQATSGGSGAPNRYEVVLGANADGTGGTVLNPGGTPFDQPVTVGSPTTFRADDATTYTLTIRDISSNGCNVVLTTTPVASCSSCETVLCPRVSLRKL